MLAERKPERLEQYARVFGIKRTFSSLDDMLKSDGSDWKKVAGFPPMYYPTHSVSMILSVTGARATKISCFGYVDKNDDGIFRQGGNLWDNPFSNKTALARTSDGGSMRLNEFRRVGWGGPNSIYLSMFGTEGCYEEHAGGSAWTTLDRNHVTDVTDELKCTDAYVKMDELEVGLHEALKHDFNSSLANVHNKARLPQAYGKMPNGHFGSHQFLVDDFVKWIKTGKLSPNHVWNAARYLIPGFVAHESAKRDGELLEIPDFGDAPAQWEQLDPESFRAE